MNVGARVVGLAIGPVSAIAFALSLVQCAGLRTGGVDASMEDAASPTEDAGDDVAPAIDAASQVSFCKTVTPVPNFCEDFDQGDLETGFLNDKMSPDPGIQGVGMILADTNVATSYDGTRSVAFQISPLISTTDKAAAQLLTIVPIVPKDLIIYFDMRVLTEDIPNSGNSANDGNLFILSTEWGRPGMDAPGGFDIFRDAEGMALSVSDVDNVGPVIRFTQPVPVGAWKEIKLILYNRPMNDGGPEGQLHVYVDGLLAAQSTIPVGYQSSANTPILTIGVPIARGPMQTFQMSIDNVRVLWD